MVIKVTVHSEARNVHYAEDFDNESDAIKWLNDILSRHELNDGQTLASSEDIPAANGVIADMFYDLYNMQNFIEYQEIEDEQRESMKTAYLSGIKAELELQLREEDISIAYHSGDCTDGVSEVYAKEYIKEQLAKFDKDAMIDILDNVGYAFDENDRDEIEQLIVFEAAASLTDEE